MKSLQAQDSIIQLNRNERQHLPRLRQGLRLEHLKLEPRTFNCLVQGGFQEQPARLSGLRISALFELYGFGEKCLLDLLTALKLFKVEPATPASKAERLQMLDEARRLRDLPAASDIRADDPRLGQLIRSISFSAQTARDVAEQIIKKENTAADAPLIAARLKELREGAEELATLSLEEELRELAIGVRTARQREIAMRRFGWDGTRPRTLAEVGIEFNLTRERVRHIADMVEDALSGKRPYAPVLSRALEFIRANYSSPDGVSSARQNFVPDISDKIARELAKRKLSRRAFSLTSLYSAARLLGHRMEELPSILVNEAIRAGNGHALGANERLIRDSERSIVNLVVKTASRLIIECGATRFSEVVKAINSGAYARKANINTRGRDGGGKVKIDEETVARIIRRQDRFQVLDETEGWFYNRARKRQFLELGVRRVVAVARKITATELRAALCRDRSKGRDTSKFPPPDILLALCRRMLGMGVKKETIFSKVPERDVSKLLSPNERVIYKVMREHGAAMRYWRIVALCGANNLSEGMTSQVLLRTPILTKHNQGIYVLIGAKISKSEMDAVLIDESPQVERVRVYVRHMTKRERENLEELAKSSVPTATDRQLQRRAQLLLASADGLTINELRRRFKCGDRFVSRTIKEFNRDRIKSLQSNASTHTTQFDS